MTAKSGRRARRSRITSSASFRSIVSRRSSRVVVAATALVVVGDGDGMVGVGYGKAKEARPPSRRGGRGEKELLPALGFKARFHTRSPAKPQRAWSCSARQAPGTALSPEGRFVRSWSVPEFMMC